MIDELNVESSGGPGTHLHYAAEAMMDMVEAGDDETNVYREASQRFVGVLVEIVGIVIERHPDPIWYGLAHAIDHPTIAHQSMAETSRRIGVTRSNLSKHAARWRDLLGLLASSSQRSDEYRRMRRVMAVERWRQLKRETETR